MMCALRGIFLQNSFRDGERKFLEPLARRRKGPHRFIQNRSLTFVAALKATLQQRSPKINLRERFSIFDFCNKIRGRAEVRFRTCQVSFCPQETLVSWNAKLFPQVEGGLACL